MQGARWTDTLMFVGVDVPDSAVCLGCGYSLRGLPGPMCPECGRTFNPGDPKTFQDTSKPWPWRREPGPPGRQHMVIVIAMTAIALATCSSPGQSLGLSCAYLLVVPVLGLALVVDYVRAIMTTIRAGPAWRESLPSPRRIERAWWITPVCLALIASPMLYPWPAWIRFRVSQSAFERIVEAGTTPSRPSIGLYYVRDVQRLGNGVVYFETGHHGIDTAGFLYIPNSASIRNTDLYTRARLTKFWHIGGWRF